MKGEPVFVWKRSSTPALTQLGMGWHQTLLAVASPIIVLSLDSLDVEQQSQKLLFSPIHQVSIPQVFSSSYTVV
jgi:hypothetical protein